MRTGKQRYILIWIALISVITGATFLLLVSFTGPMVPALRTLTSFIAWGLVIVPSIFLFITASAGNIAHMSLSEEESEPAAASTRTQPSDQQEKKTLDIRAVAGKITRRIDPLESPGNWGRQLMNMLVSELEIMSGIFYYREKDDLFTSLATYATPRSEDPFQFTEGEGLNGQAAMNGHVQVIRNIPEQYAKVFSGLGSGSPAYIALVPILAGGRCIALLEVAGYRWAEEPLEQLFHVIARNFSEKLESTQEKGKKGPATI